MQRVFASRTQEQWSFLMKRDTTVTPVLDIHEALDSDWAEESGAVGKVGGRAVVNQPIRFSGRPSKAPAPWLGQHTKRVLGELGYSHADVDELLASGAVA